MKKIITLLSLLILAPMVYGQQSGTITQLEQWRATSTPFSAITTNVPSKNVYIPFATATSSKIYANTFCINNTTPDCITAWNSSGSSLTGGIPLALTYWTGTSTISATSTPYVTAIVATSSTATSTFAGGLSVGTTTSSARLTLQGMLSMMNPGNKAVMVGNTTGDTRGLFAVDIQSDRTAVASRVASGTYSTTVGNNNTAVGNYTSSFGAYNTIGASVNSTAVGYNNTINNGAGNASAFGYFNTCSNGSACFGYANTGTGDVSDGTNGVFGYNNIATSNYAYLFGRNNTSYANGSIIIGQGITATSANSVQIGTSDSKKIILTSAGHLFNGNGGSIAVGDFWSSTPYQMFHAKKAAPAYYLAQNSNSYGGGTTPYSGYLFGQSPTDQYHKAGIIFDGYDTTGGGYGRGMIRFVNDGDLTSTNAEDNISSATRMVIDYNGEVGINTTSPAARLDVRSTGAGATALILDQDNSVDRVWQQFTYSGNSGSYADFRIASGAFVLQSVVDKVRIAPAASTNQFDFVGNSGQPYLQIDNGTVQAFTGHANNTDGFVLGSISNHNVSIRTNNTAKVTITPSGTVGIGSSTPSMTLSVESSSGTTTISHGSPTKPSCDQFYSGNGTAYYTFMSNAGVPTTVAGTCP